jgi:hypothetical protein
MYGSVTVLRSSYSEVKRRLHKIFKREKFVDILGHFLGV